MSSSAVARRYAAALLSVGVEDGRFESYADEIERLDKAFQSSAELRDLWLNPASLRERRLAAVDALREPLRLSEPVTNLLRLLVERRRLAQLSSLVAAYRAMVDDRAGRARALVTSASPLSAEVSSRLADVLASLTGKSIVLDSQVDPALLGGVVAQVGSSVYDGSLRTQLAQLRQVLSQSRL